MDNRRNVAGSKILKTLLGTSFANLLLPAGRAIETSERRLWFYHTHTGEQLDVTYARDGRHIDSALTEVNEFLSDFRTGDVTTMIRATA